MNRYALRCDKGCDCMMLHSPDNMCSNKLIFIRVGASLTLGVCNLLVKLDISEFAPRLHYLDNLICSKVENGFISV